MSTRPRSSQVRHIQNAKQLGTQVGASAENIIGKINTEFDSPLKLHATFPTPDAKLNFSDSLLSTADGAKKVMPSVNNSVVTNLNGAWINFQTQALSNAAHFTISWPGTNTVGRFRIAAFELGNDYKINVTFSAEAVTEAALVDPGTLFTSGLPLGYVILECTNATGYFKTAGSTSNIIENAKIHRIAAGGGGNSGSDSLPEEAVALRNSLDSSYFKYLTPSIFSSDGQNLVDNVNTTATYSAGTKTYDFTSGQILRSLDLVDNSLYEEGKDIDSAMLTVFWDKNNVDTNATYQLSRDNGVTWQNVSMIRNNLTGEYSGVKKFSEETYSTGGSLTTTGGQVLNANTTRSVSQRLILSDTRIVNQFTFEFTKTGSPNGTLTIKLVKDNGGNPSTASADLISLIDIKLSDISSGTNTRTINFGKQVLKSGTYHIVFETDQLYKNSFVSGSHELQVRIGSAGSDPEAKTYNGTTWTNITGSSVKFTYNFKVLTLLVRVTASMTAKMVGFGVLYLEQNKLVSPVSYLQIIVGSQAQVDAGIATHSSLQSAINDAGMGSMIFLLKSEIVENVTITQSNLVIDGEGREAILNGNMTINGNNNILQNFKIKNNLTLNGNHNTLRDCWVGGNITDNGTLNSLSIIWDD